MLIEKTLEEKIVSAVSGALNAVGIPFTIVGFWQPSAMGEVKHWESDPSSAALIGIVTGLGQQDTFSNPTVAFDVAVNLIVRAELDTQAANILKFVEPISELFKGWMASTYQQTFTALDIEGLSVDGVGVKGGTPELDTSAKVVRVGWSLNLSGSYQPTNE